MDKPEQKHKEEPVAVPNEGASSGGGDEEDAFQNARAKRRRASRAAGAAEAILEGVKAEGEGWPLLGYVEDDFEEAKKALAEAEKEYRNAERALKAKVRKIAAEARASEETTKGPEGI